MLGCILLFKFSSRPYRRRAPCQYKSESGVVWTRTLGVVVSNMPSRWRAMKQPVGVRMLQGGRTVNRPMLVAGIDKVASS